MDISSSRKAIAFDLDGTLIDISKRDFTVYSDILLNMGYKPIGFDLYWRSRVSKVPINEILSESMCIHDKDVACFIAKRTKFIDDANYLKLDTLFDNTLNVLSKLALGYDLYLVTSRGRIAETLCQLNELGLSSFFKEVFVVNGEKLNTLRGIKNLIAMVGDTENDIVPSNALEITSIALNSGIRSKSFLKKLKPTYQFDDILEVIKIFK